MSVFRWVWLLPVLTILWGGCASTPPPAKKRLSKKARIAKQRAKKSAAAKKARAEAARIKAAKAEVDAQAAQGKTIASQTAQARAQAQAAEASAGDLAAAVPQTPPDIPLTSGGPVSQPGASAQDAQAAPVAQDCTPLPRPDMATIRYLPALRVFFTGLFDACRPPDVGYRKGFFWVGMGIPCTGGEGRIKVVGKSSFPKKVVFRLDNACPMALNAGQANLPHIPQILKFPQTSKVLALYPLDTLYWHFAGTAAAGVGNDVTVHRGHLSIWNKIHAGQKVPLRIVGRENSFKPSGKLFAVEGMLSRGATAGGFVLEIVTATVLNDAQRAMIFKECRIRVRDRVQREDCMSLAPPTQPK